ncbi:hypothetical protein BDE02_08G100600 [Populus trichocarpa]|nr:hypothetical protein BDE02_08G100600 [Populus trichocarpa]
MVKIHPLPAIFLVARLLSIDISPQRRRFFARHSCYGAIFLVARLLSIDISPQRRRFFACWQTPCQ